MPATFPTGYPRRGEIYWVDLPPPEGSEPGGKRPFLVVSNDPGNSAGQVVIGAVISETRRRSYPQNVDVPDSVGSISGTILCGQLVTVNKTRLRDYQGALDVVDMWRVNAALKASLAIP